jgi:uncharacterized protein
MEMLKYRFVWDEGKALANERKHGITFASGASALDDPLLVYSENVDHEGFDERWTIVGATTNGVLVFVVFTVDEVEGCTRIISVRKATSHERREYESGEYAVREPEMTDEYNVKPVPPEPQVDDDYDDGTRKEFDFSKGKRGVSKNCRFPVPIDSEVLGYFHTRAVKLGIDRTEAINEILRAHVGLPKRTEPVETFREALRRHFGGRPRSAKSSRTPDTGAAGDDAERR